MEINNLYVINLIVRELLSLKHKKKIKCLVSLVIILFLANQCTQNPFFEDNYIPTEKQWVRGKVELSTGAVGNGAAVWLEGYEIGTFTDDKGQFNLQLPGGSLGGGAENGIFKLYFYINNFELTYREVMVREGQVFDGELDIEQDGHLKNAVMLQELLGMHTEASLRIHVTPCGHIDTLLGLKSTCSISKLPLHILNKGARINCFFLFPQNIEGMNEIVFDNKALDTNLMMLGTPVWEAGYEMTLNGGHLKKGEYYYIPWFVVYQPGFPEAMKTFLGYDMYSVDKAYLNLPFKRGGGRFYLDYKAMEIYNIN